MRYTLVILFLLSSLHANHVKWLGDFEEAHKEALKSSKNIMVFLVKKECPLCKEVLIKSFTNQPYIDKINKEFVCVIVNKEQKESYPIEMLYTDTYPTLFLLDKNELFIGVPIKGQITPYIIKNTLLP